MNGESFHYADNIVQLRSRQWKQKGVIVLKRAEKNSATRHSARRREERETKEAENLCRDRSGVSSFSSPSLFFDDTE
jgi:hypothetical protein